jgi:hypothetical protein
LYVVPFTVSAPERPFTIVAIISLGSNDLRMMIQRWNGAALKRESR